MSRRIMIMRGRRVMKEELDVYVYSKSVGTKEAAGLQF